MDARSDGEFDAERAAAGQRFANCRNCVCGLLPAYDIFAYDFRALEAAGRLIMKPPFFSLPFNSCWVGCLATIFAA